jgi:hypothetical protein
MTARTIGALRLRAQTSARRCRRYWPGLGPAARLSRRDLLVHRPIGAIGRPWEEHVLLRIARVAESLVERKPPKVALHLLPEVDLFR